MNAYNIPNTHNKTISLAKISVDSLRYFKVISTSDFDHAYRKTKKLREDLFSIKGKKILVKHFEIYCILIKTYKKKLYKNNVQF